MIVAGNTIHADHAATLTTMQQRPFAIIADGDADRFHPTMTFAHPIAALPVNMQAPEAMRAVVAMPRSRRLAGNGLTTMLAGKKESGRRIGSTIR